VPICRFSTDFMKYALYILRRTALWRDRRQSFECRFSYIHPQIFELHMLLFLQIWYYNMLWTFSDGCYIVYLLVLKSYWVVSSFSRKTCLCVARNWIFDRRWCLDILCLLLLRGCLFPVLLLAFFLCFSKHYCLYLSRWSSCYIFHTNYIIYIIIYIDNSYCYICLYF